MMKYLRIGLITLALCAPATASAQFSKECDPENYSGRPPKEQAPIDKAFKAEPKLDEIQVLVRAPLERVKTRVMEAMLACKMPVSLSNEGVLIADYGSHMGFAANFSIVARAILLPVSDSTVMVRLVGVEQSKGTYQNAQKPITNKNVGNSQITWIAMRNVAKQLFADSAMRVDRSKSTTLGLVYPPAAITP